MYTPYVTSGLFVSIISLYTPSCQTHQDHDSKYFLQGSAFFGYPDHVVYNGGVWASLLIFTTVCDIFVSLVCLEIMDYFKDKCS